MKVLVVTNMYPTPEQPAFGTFVRDQVEALRDAGMEVTVLFINGRKSRINYLLGIFGYWWRLLRDRYDIIHAHYGITGLVARLQFARPLVVTYHGGEVKDHVPRWLRLLARSGPRLFDRVIVVNELEKQMLNDDRRVSVIPCGVDLDVFQPACRSEARLTLGLPASRPLVLWAGEHWQWEKRFELVEESLQLLKRRLPEVELVFVSGQPHSVIPTYMNACDVLVLTSRSEGSPMVIKEAMACNLPIVSTDVGDVAEVIRGGEGCYLVEPVAEDIADKLYQALQRGQRTDGRSRIGHLGSIEIANRIVAVYREVCSMKG